MNPINRIRKNTIYFGHPINTYGTEFEEKLIQIISNAFPGWFIENPNQKHHQEGYKSWKEKHGNGMDYFYKKVLPDCHAGIFLPFRDDKWGAGVYGEAKRLAQLKRMIFKIDIHEKIYRISNLNMQSVLTIEETRLRLRDANGNIIPY